MPKISLDNLERYDGHLKDWCDARFAERKVHENWHEAGPLGAVSFYPVPNCPIDPVVNFAFTETLPEGTKGPDNPSTITGVSSITATLCETVGVDSTDYTIDLNDSFYGGSVDLSTGVMTVTHKYIQLTGANANIYFNEDIGTYNRFSITSVDSVRLEPAADYTNPQSCTHFNFAANWTLDAPHFYVATASLGTAYFYSDYATVDALNTWLAGQYQAGTPLEFVYPLATPYTVQLTPTQIYSLSQTDPYTPRINTVYSDQQSVLVRYPKSPIVTGSELDDAILSLGGD